MLTKTKTEMFRARIGSWLQLKHYDIWAAFSTQILSLAIGNKLTKYFLHENSSKIVINVNLKCLK